MTDTINDELFLEDDYDDEKDDLLNSNTEQYFYFLSGGMKYAMAASSVVEIIEYQHITHVPLMNSYILGITNIRGSIIGVVDLLERFEQTKTVLTKKTALVIVRISYENKEYQVALMVDEILEVDGADIGSITDVPTFGTKIKTSFISSMARYDEKEVYLLNLDNILDIEELSQLCIGEALSDKFYTREVKQKIYKYQTEDESYFEEDDDEIDISLLISNSTSKINQYLVFEGPNNQYYAKNVSKIEELVVSGDFDIQKNFDTSVVTGTANIRGGMITLLNFDRWLGLKEIEDSLYKELIVVNMGQHKFGLLVRSTEYIVTIDNSQMKKSSDGDNKSTFISSIVLNGKDVMCTIVDSDKMLMDSFESEKEKSEDDLKQIEKLEIDKTILFADDSGLIRNSVSSIAKRLDINYDIFENGLLLLNKLDTLNAQTVGLIVTDLEMPIMDGKELIMKIRNNNKYDNINIIVYTNMANKILVNELEQIGATKIINKIDVKSLTNAIKEFIS